MKVPSVGIGFPVYNGERLIERALKSLLAQDQEGIEIVISDNASTDRTGEVCCDFAAQDSRVRYHRVERNRGAAWNFKNVFNLSRGEFFMWAAHDDLWASACVRRCIEVLRERPDAVLCHHSSQPFDDDGIAVGAPYVSEEYVNDLPTVEQRWWRAMTAWSLHTTIYGVMRRDVAAKTRPVGARTGSDQIFIAEMSLHGSIVRTPEVLSWKLIPRGAYRTEEETIEYVGGSKRRLPPYVGLYVQMLAALAHAPLSSALKARLVASTLRAYAREGVHRDVVSSAIRVLGPQRYERLRRRA